MDAKTLETLEYPRVLGKLAEYAAFEVSAELALTLMPTSQIDEVQRRQACTREARFLLNLNGDFSIRGTRDIREMVDLANHHAILEPLHLVDIKNTLVAARQIFRFFEKELDQYPNLAVIGADLDPPAGLVDIISRTISDHGEVLDSASPRLANLRRELKKSHDRLLSKLERMINGAETAPMLQEQIITQRNGRYVIPLRAEFKGRIKAITHDQSASGATLFIEPISVVDLNNEFQELKLSVRDEERRILAEISQKIGLEADAILRVIFSLAKLDLALMCAKYAEDTASVEPILVPFSPETDTHPGSIIRIQQARHPLLEADQVVPIDLVLDPATFMVIITGPNTGGKTVTLKTVGLLALMAQSGLHIPALSGSEISIFENIFADIGDEQSIEQSLSTFSAHIKNIIHIIQHADRKSLVLLDELGAGTDPQEGSALAGALLTYLVEKHITSLVATHFPELKALAHSIKGMSNASMEFDIKTLKPTYRLIMGLPGRSNALLIAGRLGLPQQILDFARRQIDPAHLKTDDLLDEIHHQRDIARQDRKQAAEARHEIESMRKELAERLEVIEEERVEILERARKNAEIEILELQAELTALRQELKRSGKPLENLGQVQEKVEELADAASQPIKRKKRTTLHKGPLRTGEKVSLSKFGMEGTISAIDDETIEVQAGNLRVRVQKDDVQRLAEKSEEKDGKTKKSGDSQNRSTPVLAQTVSPGIEIDLRGLIVEEALLKLERYLENAYLSGLPYSRVIHGKGTGRVREMVRKALNHSTYISSWESGMENEGGDGVTVVHYKYD
jgi:DNA mismatch repair protein MutS2